MARAVQEIMNRELLAVRPDLSARAARDLMRSFAVGAAPVLDEGRRPLGVVSLHDDLDSDRLVSHAMNRPALCIDEGATIEHAARQVAQGDQHHLVVVDANGAAVGVVSTLDLLRALLGLPVRHPSTFPHWDEATHVSWSDEWPLEGASFKHAGDGAGIITLAVGSPGATDTVVWAEACLDVRARLVEMVAHPDDQCPPLTRTLTLGGLRFRAALVPDEARRARIAAQLCEQIEHAPPPGAT